jgi:uncharacterized protein (DUF1015 family)
LEARDAREMLDVTLLQKHVLEPIFGIDDPRTSQRINSSAAFAARRNWKSW